MTSLNVLDLVVWLSTRHSIYFQWVPSHIGLNGNEIADSLANSATADTLGGLNFAELSSIKRVEFNALWRTPPAHPRGRHQLNSSRNQQTTLHVFLVVKCLTFNQVQKVFPKVLVNSSSNHILNRLNFIIDEVLGNPI
ncbi:hypothetical protein TNCV_739081 [Trichonephila clavipes]|nr:hypothetical protein TNCV_739081 [Trichonephila clavipes]